MAYIKQKDLIYSFKQDCECKMIKLDGKCNLFLYEIGDIRQQKSEYI